MLFTSPVFFELLIVTFVLYYLPKFSRFQVPILIAASLIFYSYDQLQLVLLLLFSATLNIFSSYYIIHGKAKWKKTVITCAVTLNLAGIAFFKYSPLISKTFFNPGESVGRFLLEIPLPIGISFFTFEGISLLVDVWRNQIADKQNIVSRSLYSHVQNTLFFISFFPHLIAGPILKAHDFFPQIEKKKFQNIDWIACIKSLIVGYFLKMVVADNLKDFTFWIAYPFYQSQSSVDLIMMLFGYSFQIFTDFAGYSLIAIGLAKLFGYNFSPNFNYPYISASFKEFWKRWHISLSSFLMEYLYIPLGGNKKGEVRTYLNLFITMVLGGLWHGAAWSYAIWGGFHGVALASERFITGKIKINQTGLVLFTKRISIFLFITLAWLLFKLPNFSDVIGFFKAVGNNWAKPVNVSGIGCILMYSTPVVLYHMAHLYRSQYWFRFNKVEYVFYSVLLFLIICNSGSGGSFIYFQF